MDLKKIKHIHFMGICGTAMASLAGLLKERGFHITGSDTDVYPPMSTLLERFGITIRTGFKKENLTPKPDLVIVGNVIREVYEEAQALLKSDIPYMSLPQALCEFLIEKRESIVISGTHGKTTTTSIMAWIAETCEKKFGFLIGGIPKNFGVSFKDQQGDYFIVEGDEYDTAFFDKTPKFLHYKPLHVILTSIEFDHADIYESLDDIKNAFRKMVELIPDENGTLVGCADDPVVMELLHSFKSKNYFTYGIHSGDYQIQSSKPKNGYTPYSVSLRGTEILQGETSLFGAHNLKNALSCIALSHQLGWDMDLVKEALRRFQGVKRRQEIIGEPGGKVVIEDFAHHPTAVRETIASIQNYYKGRKVFSVFEPRSATSRKQIFQNEYVEAFLKADETILARPYNKNSTSVNDLFSSDFVTSELSKRGLAAQTLNNADSIVSYLCKTARPGDVILIMSNGSFGNICQKLLKSLEGI